MLTQRIVALSEFGPQQHESDNGHDVSQLEAGAQGDFDVSLNRVNWTKGDKLASKGIGSCNAHHFYELFGACEVIDALPALQ